MKCRISYSAFSSPHSQISAIALKLLPVFTRGIYSRWKRENRGSDLDPVAIALRLLPVFTRLLGRWKIKELKKYCYFSRNRPQALTCFHTGRKLRKWHWMWNARRETSQSPSSSYLFSHKDLFWKDFGFVAVNKKAAIALRLLPVFTQLLFLMQKSCAFLNPKILTSLSNPIWVDQ